MKHGDIILGTVGSTATFTLGALNFWLGIAAGVLTVSVMSVRLIRELLKFRRDWKHRNDSTDDNPTTIK